MPTLDPHSITELAAAVADGRMPDWDAVQSETTDDGDRQTIAKLRTVAKIAELFTSLTAGPLTPSSDHHVLAPGTMWGGLRVIEHVGHGRFGHVYRAWDPTLDRDVALKLLDASRIHSDVETADVIEEGRLMARVRHPNVATIHGAQRIDGVTGLWMEFVRGRTLAGELEERGPFDAEELVPIGVELCDALAAVHAAGLVHRDVKAQNVIREANGRVVLGDFGTGRDLNELTPASGALAGTPAYVAPEIFAGESATPLSDVYSLGVLLFHLATRSYPVHGRSLRELRDRHAQGQRTPLRSLREGLPERLADVIETAIDPVPAQRFTTAESMAHALEASLNRRSETRRISRQWLAALTAVMAVTVAAGAWFVSHAEPRPLPFAARDWLLITRFENRTSDPLLDGTVHRALERELFDSPYVNVVAQQRQIDALLLIGRPTDTAVDVSIGREMATRDSKIRLLLGGRVATTNPGYRLEADIIAPSDGAVMRTVTETAAQASDLLPATQRLALGVRTALGEPLPPSSVSERIAPPTTSLHAFKLYTSALDVMRGEDTPPARAKVRQLLREALSEDPSFFLARVLYAESVASEQRLAEADRALELLPKNLPQAERLWVTARIHQIRANNSIEPLQREQSNERAVAAYEALLKIRPDLQLAMADLAEAYVRTGRSKEATALRVRVADLRPTGAMPQINAARNLLSQNQLSDARHYIDRARLLHPPRSSLGPWLAAWFSLYDAWEAWLRDDPRRALALADRVAEDTLALSGVMRQQSAHQLACMYMALGRMKQAKQVVSLMPEIPWPNMRLQDWTMALILDNAEDVTALRRLLDTRFTKQETDGNVGSFLIDVGQLDRARRAVTSFPRLHYEGQLALAEGRISDAIRILELARARPASVSDANQLRSARKLAEALQRIGRIDQAIQVLEAESSNRGETTSGFEWLRVRAQLADSYRLAGRADDAQKVDSELLTLLAVADDDHPIKRRLTSRYRSSSPEGRP
jgi:tetratricopeptide (TPR) repeat protein